MKPHSFNNNKNNRPPQGGHKFETIMENLIFTINGNNPGELVHFEVEFEKGKFKNVWSNVSLFKTIDDVVNAEKQGLFKII